MVMVQVPAAVKLAKALGWLIAFCRTSSAACSFPQGDPVLGGPGIPAWASVWALPASAMVTV